MVLLRINITYLRLFIRKKCIPFVATKRSSNYQKTQDQHDTLNSYGHIDMDLIQPMSDMLSLLCQILY